MKEFTGISASPGIIIGKIFLYLDQYPEIPQYAISKESVSSENERYLDAKERAIIELEGLKQDMEGKVDHKNHQFLDAHILMLKDPELDRSVGESIESDMFNAEYSVYTTVKRYADQLSSSEDPYLKERAVDLIDVSRRIMNHLQFREALKLSDIREEVILVAHTLLPSEALGMNKEMIRGIALDAGGKTSHTAILARAFEIPAVVGLSNITSACRMGDTVIIDGNMGKVIVDPDEATVDLYRNRIIEWQQREVQLLNLNELPGETRDGKLIELQANIEVPEETDAAMMHGADGIGLYRSEFLFLLPGGVSPEDEQMEAYSRVLKSMDGPVTIRTLDLGGDKALALYDVTQEDNPILGWRAVRYCLSHEDLFRSQLRALLRASIHGDLRIMFPMISGAAELEAVLELLNDVKTELHANGIPYKNNIPVGIMIEVPSAAMISDILARKVDFFSIGTNDLIQYTIAVDRGNEKIAYLYEPFHIGVLRMIKMIIDNAHAVGIPVSMCGEMAGDPLATVILAGLGLDIFSMSAASIPEVKQIIRSISLSQAEEFVGIIMEMRSHKEINRYIKEWMRERFDIIIN